MAKFEPWISIQEPGATLVKPPKSLRLTTPPLWMEGGCVGVAGVATKIPPSTMFQRTI